MQRPNDGETRSAPADGETLVACVNHPAEFDAEWLRRRITGCVRPVELLALPYKESMALRRARQAGGLPRELRDRVPEIGGDLARGLARAEVLMGLDVTESLLERAPRLRWVQAYSAGTDHFDLELLERRGIALSTASGAGAVPIAEFVIARLLEVWKSTRSIETMQRERRFTRPPGRTLAGCTLGIVGLGAIGGAVAERARALGMRVLATRRRFAPGQTSPLADELYGPDGLDDVLERCDALVLAAPATPETRDLIDARALARLRRGAVLCNVARGALLDETALIEALCEGRLAAAILDVTREEPLPPGHPLWDAPNLYLSPHCAVSPDAYDRRVLELFADNLERYAAGLPPLNLAVPGEGP
ncbi:MAG: D-2-hydroxyacid dehydrogenase [Proteobacteria bacterium]|nr:D-2-hydroxyacid dehydrogenase [Pseudomonadota bacterium]